VLTRSSPGGAEDRVTRPAARPDEPADEIGTAGPDPVVPAEQHVSLDRGIPSGHPVATLSTMDNLGPRLKELRQAAGMTLRELARQAEVSPSLVSQIENGKSRPSVSTLYSFAQLLNVPVDELFDVEAVDGAPPRAPHDDRVDETVADPANAWRPSEYATRISVVHPSHRAHIRMAEGVDWERLAATPERDVNFMKITYAPGATSNPDGSLMVHEGFEYGYVVSGALEVTVGNEVFVLREGESLGFDSAIPHQLRNIGAEDFHGIWFVHGKRH
jgi:transcriptional regulator with XRE-family HTH domain